MGDSTRDYTSGRDPNWHGPEHMQSRVSKGKAERGNTEMLAETQLGEDAELAFSLLQGVEEPLRLA